MAFERVLIKAKQASTGTGFKVVLSKRVGPAIMRFTVTKTVANELGWSHDDKLEVFIGTDGDHGLLRFRKNNSVGDAVVSFKKTQKGEWVSINIGHQSRFVDEAQPSAWCQFEKLDGGYVEVVLPRWADRTAPKKPVAEVRPVGRPPLDPARRPASVTSSIMGDPPPNRREMLAKIGEVKP